MTYLYQNKSLFQTVTLTLGEKSKSTFSSQDAVFCCSIDQSYVQIVQMTHLAFIL